MVNAKHDTHSYERTVNGERGYQREILFDGNVLYDSYLRAKKGSDWKPQVQRFEKNYLLNLAAIQSKLKDGSYEFSKGSHFILRERGKTRPISGEKIEDRIIKHALCDTMLQIQYSLTDTGRIIQKINPVRLTAMRRKMKKIAPRLTEKEFSDFYNSWFKSHYKYMSKMQRYNMDTLYAELKEKTKCTL